MVTLQKKWLRAISLFVLCFAILSVAFVVKAEVNKHNDLKGAKKIDKISPVTRAEKTHKKKKMITDDFIVQSSLTSFTPQASVTGSCNGAASTRYCRYDVTEDGKDNIPSQASYTAANIDNYVSAGYLTHHAGSSLVVWNP